MLNTYFFTLLALVIGFNQSSWTFDEPDTTTREQILLVKENNRPTEQTFDVRINLGPIAGAATEGEDYAVTGLINGIIDFQFLPSLEYVAFNLTLFPDNIAEGNEGFTLITSPVKEPRYTFPSQGSGVYRTEIVVIRDNDRKWCRMFIIVMNFR